MSTIIVGGPTSPEVKSLGTPPVQIPPMPSTQRLVGGVRTDIDLQVGTEIVTLPAIDVVPSET